MRRAASSVKTSFLILLTDIYRNFKHVVQPPNLPTRRDPTSSTNENAFGGAPPMLVARRLCFAFQFKQAERPGGTKERTCALRVPERVTGVQKVCTAEWNV